MADAQSTLRYWNDPVKSGRCNWRMKVVYLVSGGSLSPKQRQSYMSEGTSLCGSGSPIFSLHHAVVSCGTAKRDPISLVIGAHTSKGAGPGDSTFEVINVWNEPLN